MINRHHADIFKGDGVNPAPYATSVAREVTLREAVDAMSKVVKTIPTNRNDSHLFHNALDALEWYLSKQNDNSRRLENEYNDRFSS